MDGSEEDSIALIRSWRSSFTKSSLLGKRRSCSTVTRYEWVFLTLISLSLSIILGITLFRIFDLPISSSDFTLAVVFLINLLFCFLYAFHGVLFEQPHEIIFLVLSTVIVIVYTLLSYSSDNINDTVKTARLIYTAFVGPIIVVTGLQIGCHYRNSGNLIFRTVGGDPFMQSIGRKAQLHCVLLFFDMQAILSCLVLIVHAVEVTLDQELMVLIMGIIFTIGWTLLGYMTVRYENTICFAVFLSLSALQPSFIAWRLVSSGFNQTDALELSVTNVSGTFFLIVHSYLIANTLQVYRNFGKGLKERIFENQGSNQQYGTFQEPVIT